MRPGSSDIARGPYKGWSVYGVSRGDDSRAVKALDPTAGGRVRT